MMTVLIMGPEITIIKMLCYCLLQTEEVHIGQDKSLIARKRKPLFTNSSSLICYRAYIKRVTGIQKLQDLLVRNM